jgi:hypothetical protein
VLARRCDSDSVDDGYWVFWQVFEQSGNSERVGRVGFSRDGQIVEEGSSSHQILPGEMRGRRAGFAEQLPWTSEPGLPSITSSDSRLLLNQITQMAQRAAQIVRSEEAHARLAEEIDQALERQRILHERIWGH